MFDIKKEQNNLKMEYLKLFFYSFSIIIIANLIHICMTGYPFLSDGDYFLQQIPMGTNLNRILKSGNFQIDLNNNLGLDIVSGYNFYILFSPFYLFTLLFPPEIYQHLILPMYAVKIGLASVTACLYLNRHIELKYAKFVAVLYAFSGWQMITFTFNHFAEPLVLFPLLLISFDDLIQHNKKCFFAIMVALSAMVNYYFFFGEIIFIIIYFVIRLIFDRSYNIKLKNLINVLIEGFIAFLLSALSIIPTIDFLKHFYRTTAVLENIFYYKDFDIYLSLLKSIFLLPDTFGTDGILGTPYGFSSISLYLPFGMYIFFTLFVYLFVKQLITDKNKKDIAMENDINAISLNKNIITTIKNNDNGWLFMLLITVIIFALIPILNSSFQLFNNVYYTRWFYMPILFFALMAVKSFKEWISNKEAYQKDIKNTYTVLFALFAFIILFAMFTTKVTKDNVKEFIIQGAFFVIFYLIHNLYLIKNIKITSKKFLIILFTCLTIIQQTLFMPPEVDLNIPEKYSKTEADIVNNIDTTNDFYRFIIHNSDNGNINLLLNKPATSGFISTYSEETYLFYDPIVKERDTNNFFSAGYLNFNSILSGKYLILSSFAQYGNLDKYPNYEKVFEDDLFTIYENKNYVPLGIPYEYYLTESEYAQLQIYSRESIVNRALIIKDEDEEYLSKHLKHYETPILSTENYVKNSTINFEVLKNTAKNNIKNTIVNKNIVSSVVEMEETRIVMYSFANNRYWKAYIDEIETPIYTVHNGLIGIEIPKGNHEVKLVYENLSVKVGAITSTFGIIAVCAWFFLNKKKKK